MESTVLRKELQDLLGMLREDSFRTASHLAELLEVSEKTVRLRLKELDKELEAYGARVVSKARHGYQLLITDETKYQNISESESKNTIPETGKERNEYLLAHLVWYDGYIKSEDLCEFLYVSKTTLTKCLKSVETILKRYQLALERKPNYGIRLTGKEIDIRRLIGDCFVKGNFLEEAEKRHMEQEIIQLAGYIQKLQGKYEIHLSETSFENFVDYVYIAYKRMGRGRYLEMKISGLPEMGIKEKSFIRELIQVLESCSDGVSYTKAEESYLLLYLAGKRMIGNIVENDSNFVIREQTDRLAVLMLDTIQKTYNLDFRNNFEMRMTLNQHLVPFDIRMRFDIPLTNPLLEQIKEEYSFAYQISGEVASVLRKFYQKEISEDEIGYFALIFELALEKDKSRESFDILIVCSSGKSSSRLLKYKYQKEFSEYLNQIYVCDLLELEQFDFSKVDYIFTTVPITIEVPVPIVEVGVFLGEQDIKKINDVLRKGNGEYLRKYYCPERFLTNLEGETKEEVLEALCRVIAKQEEVDDDFYELVLEREAYVQMDYGNQIVIPHPNRIASEETFAYVAVLEHPVLWNSSPVQVIVLSSVGRKEDKDRQKFYDATARFALSRTAIEKLIEDKSYETLIELLQE